MLVPQAEAECALTHEGTQLKPLPAQLSCDSSCPKGA